MPTVPRSHRVYFSPPPSPLCPQVPPARKFEEHAPLRLDQGKPHCAQGYSNLHQTRGTKRHKHGSSKSLFFSVLAWPIGNPALSASEAANFRSGRACGAGDAHRSPMPIRIPTERRPDGSRTSLGMDRHVAKQHSQISRSLRLGILVWRQHIPVAETGGPLRSYGGRYADADGGVAAPTSSLLEQIGNRIPVPLDGSKMRR